MAEQTVATLDQCRGLGDLADFCHGHRTGARVVVELPDGSRVKCVEVRYEGTDDDLSNTLVLVAEQVA